VLSNILKQVIDELISKNESAFIVGRNISDCSLLLRDFEKKIGAGARIKLTCKRLLIVVVASFRPPRDHDTCPSSPWTIA